MPAAPSCWSCARWAPTARRRQHPGARRCHPRPEARRAWRRMHGAWAWKPCCPCGRAWPATEMTTADQDHLKSFLEMMAAERGAADNTLEAYRRDLQDFRRLPGARRGLARRGRAGRHRRLSARAVGGRHGAGLAGAPAVGRAPAVQVPVRRGRRRGRSGAGICRPQEGPGDPQDAVHRRGRSPDRGGPAPHRDHRGPRPRARPAPACADRDALRDRHARHRAGDAAALGAGGRRARADHQGQGRARAPGAAQPGRPRGARPLSQRRPARRGRRGADAAPPSTCSRRAERRGT